MANKSRKLEYVYYISVEALPDFKNHFEKFAELNDVRSRIDYRLGLICYGHGYFDSKSEPNLLKKCTAQPISVSQLLVDKGIEKVSLLKADIEGSEFRLPEDEPELLRKTERLAMEVHPQYGDATDLVRQLKAFGFKIKLVDKWGRDVKTITTPVGFLYAHKEH